jgi:hypothetical protein
MRRLKEHIVGKKDVGDSSGFFFPHAECVIYHTCDKSKNKDVEKLEEKRKWLHRRLARRS